MKDDSFKKCSIAGILIIGVLFLFAGLSDPECEESGCHNKPAPDSRYCYSHSLAHGYSTHGSSSSGGSSYGGSSGSSSYSSSPYSDLYYNGYTSRPAKSTSTPYSYSSSRSDSKSSSSYSSSSKKKTYKYDSYDDGYDDIYMDGDYDDDRYNRDSDYAEGVDDAIDELEEEGEEW